MVRHRRRCREYICKMKKLFYFICYGAIICCLAVTGGYVIEEGKKIWVRTAAEDVLSQPPAISAQGAVLVDMDTGKILYEQNVSSRLYPASTTKIMTALVALEIINECGADMQSEVVVPPEAAGVEGSSMYLKAGEKVTLEKLLYGLMLQSGNDGAQALAITLGGGSCQNFVDRMNHKAEEIGLKDTHFINPHGLSHEDHYTTAGDLAAIAVEAMKNDEFRRIVSTTQWETFYNKNKTVHEYPGGNGIKIGYTKASGRTLVASARRDDRGLIAVVLNDGNWFEDAYALMDWGFNQEVEDGV